MKETQIPLGQTEGQSLEFKAAAALEEPHNIARAVVAMLNADGGEVWIGLHESEDRAVSIDPLHETSLAMQTLLDSLVDSIEPVLSAQEVEITALEEGVLRVTVRPDPVHRPYALIRGTARHYLIRIGNRLRPMSREELKNYFKQEKSEEKYMEAVKRIAGARDLTSQLYPGSLWIRIEPVKEMDIALDNQQIEMYLQDPQMTGNRQTGWNFTVPDRRPELGKEVLSTGVDDYWTVYIHQSGAIEFLARIEVLHWKGGDREIYPLILLEYPTSLCRLARTIYTNHTDMTDRALILSDLALFGVKEWVLRPGSPRSFNYMVGRSTRQSREADLLWSKPIQHTCQDFRQSPDRCAFRLVKRVYEAFGYREDAIPIEYNKEEGRLVLPD